jgi:hypothetical protein
MSTATQLQLNPGLDLDHLPEVVIVHQLDQLVIRDRLMAFKAAWWEAAQGKRKVMIDLAALFEDLADIIELPENERGVRG